MRPPTRAELARFAAPAAFLLAVTIAILLVRAGLGSEGTAIPAEATSTRTTTTAPTTTSTTTRTRPAETRRFYTVERGDTFGSIAAALDTTVDELRVLNPGVDPTSLRVGQKIRVE
jgi:LysM repeat protein